MELHDTVFEMLVPNARVPRGTSVDKNEICVSQSPSQNGVTDDLAVSFITIERSKRGDFFEPGLSNLDIYRATSSLLFPTAFRS